MSERLGAIHAAGPCDWREGEERERVGFLVGGSAPHAIGDAEVLGASCALEVGLRGGLFSFAVCRVCACVFGAPCVCVCALAVMRIA